MIAANQIGAAARAHVPGGVLIDLPAHDLAQRVAATRQALAERAPVIYKASFLEDGVFVSVDILERKRNGFVLVEVKSTLDVKEQHVPGRGNPGPRRTASGTGMTISISKTAQPLSQRSSFCFWAMSRLQATAARD